MFLPNNIFSIHSIHRENIREKVKFESPVSKKGN